VGKKSVTGHRQQQITTALPSGEYHQLVERKPYALGMSSRVPCSHCNRPVRQLYMLHDRVWRATGTPFIFGNLHIGCVERILGRRLRAQDFYYQDIYTGVRR
jgi:hypothetical protein